MILIFFIIVLTFFILQSYENVLLTVPYNEHFNGHSSRYEYHGMLFSKKKNLMQAVILDFPQVPFKDILLKKEFLTFGNRINDTRHDGRYLQVNLKGESIFKTLPSNKFPVQLSQYGTQFYYFCSRCLYRSLKEAILFCEFIEKYSKVKSQYKLLGKDPYASRMWIGVWSECFYDCFSRHHFEELKTRFLRELYMLRKVYNGRPLRINFYLETMAEKQALKNAKSNQLLIKGSEKTKIHEVAAFASPPFASLQVNKWYNEYLETKKYKNNKFKISRVESSQFRFLLSPIVREVGVGITLEKKTISIVFAFM